MTTAPEEQGLPARHALLGSALAALEARAPELLSLTQAWVHVNSHTGNVAGVERMGDLLCEAMKTLPLEMERTAPSAPYASHLCFSTQAADISAPFLLVGHHDTVFPQGTFEDFRADATHAYGPGVLDMKGGLAVACVALHCLHDAGALESLPLRLISVSDEEVGSPSSKAFLEQRARGARAALVFEAGRAHDALVVARRGSGYARVTAHGRAAHAGNALREGRNAIVALARFVDRAEKEAGALSGGSLSTGLFRGGSTRNTVPALAEAELDLRFDNPTAQAHIEHLLHDAARLTALESEGVRLELAIHITRAPLASTKASERLAEHYGKCQLASGLLAGIAPQQGGGSDANTVGALGIPVIDGLGPRGTGFHTHDEKIEIPSLRMKACALIRFLLSDLS